MIMKLAVDKARCPPRSPSGTCVVLCYIMGLYDYTIEHNGKNSDNDNGNDKMMLMLMMVMIMKMVMMITAEKQKQRQSQ